MATASSGLQPHLCSRSMHLCTSMRRNRHLLSLQILWQLIKAAFQLLFITKHVSSPWNSELKLGCRRRSSPKYTLEMYGCIQQVFPNKWDSSWLCHWLMEVQPERSWRNSWALGALLCARITALLLLWKTKRSAVEGSFSRRVLFHAFPPLISTRRREVTGELSRNYTAIHRQFYQQILIQPLG